YDRSPRERGKPAPRHGREDDLSRTGRVTIQNSLDPFALHSQEILGLRLRRLHQAISDGVSLGLAQSRWKRHLTRLGIVGSADDIVIPTFIKISRLNSLWPTFKASNTRDRMLEKIDYIALECRASQYARRKCPET